MDYPGRLIAGFIAIILIVIFPLQYIAESFSDDMDYYVYSETKAFADDIRNKGYIDQDMYEEYINLLSRTGELYDLEIEDIHPLVGDELADYKGPYIPTDVAANKAVVKNYASHSLHMHDSCLENDLIKTSTHVHTADCYAGHRHDRSCPVRYFYTGEAVNYYRELDATGWNENGSRYSIIYLRCRSCDVILASATHSENNKGLSRTNQTVEQISFQFRYLDNNGSISQASFSIRKHFTSYEDDGTGWEWGNGIYFKLNPDWNTYLNIFNQLWGAMALNLSDWINLGLNTAYSCWNCLSLGRIRKTLTSEYCCGQKQDETPICDRVVTGITAANPSQTVIQGNNIDTTVIAVYLDGHTGRVSTTASGFNPNLLGNQNVTLTYRGLIRNAKTTGELTCTVSVLVKAAKTLSSISVSPATQIVDRLSNPSFTVTANYSDGSKTVLNSSQYSMTGYDSSKMGAQTVTFSYTEDGVTKTATATVYVNALSSITVSPAEIIVDRYTDASLLKFTVTASYLYGSSKTISSGYVISGYQPSVLGKQTVTISYTEKGITKTTTAIVYVNGLSSITVSPTELTVQRYTDASSLKFTVTATYLYGSNKTINSGYVISGYQPSVLGKQNVTVSYTDKDITKTATVKINVTVLKKLCPKCGNTYDLNTDDTDPGCPFCKQQIVGIEASPDYVEVTQGDFLPVTVQAIYRNGSRNNVSGWKSNYNSNKIGVQTVTIEYGGFAAVIKVNVKERMLTCPTCGGQYPISAGECPVCSEKVISISVNPMSVTVRQHEKINLTVTAYYANGKSRTVDDWSIDKTTAKAGSYKATVTYKNCSAIIELTIIAITDEQCPICGLIYDPMENPNGCPVCFTTLTGIEAYLINGSNKVQYGTYPDISVVLIFRDGHRELRTDGYILENYNPYQLGVQTVIVRYNTFSAKLTLEVVNTLTTVMCPNGHLYYLNEDGTDPGCPYCKSASSKTTVRYYEISYTTEILEQVYKAGLYQFSKGNFVTIRLIKRDKSLFYKLQKMFFKTSMFGRRKSFIFGGEVY